MIEEMDRRGQMGRSTRNEKYDRDMGRKNKKVGEKDRKIRKGFK